jgi:hypothetical protein
MARMKRALIVASVVVALVVAWLALGRQLVWLADQVATNGEAAATAGPFVHVPGWLNVGKTPLELSARGPAGELRIDADEAGRVSLHAGGRDFTFGSRVPPAGAPEPYDIWFAPDPGDTVTFRIAHSMIAWPTPFELNVISGNSPSWKRNVYYTLNWRKHDGSALEMTWRYEQWCYDDWGSPMMTRAGATGLKSVRISRD